MSDSSLRELKRANSGITKPSDKKDILHSLISKKEEIVFFLCCQKVESDLEVSSKQIKHAYL
jgi:hypothetical protein